MKYKLFILILEDDELYSAATITNLGEANGFFRKSGGVFPETLKSEALREAKLRVRHTLARLAANHHFARTGDGQIVIPGHAALPGWFGWRWKELVKN